MQYSNSRRTMRAILLSLIILLPVAIGGCEGTEQEQAAQQPDEFQQRIEALIAESYNADGPGVAVIVRQGNEILYRSAVGMADLELGVPLSADHVFRIGSVTKQFTSAAIMLLVEDGKIGLDEPMTTYLPDFNTQGRTVTIRHLLTHTSGIKSYTSLPDFSSFWRTDMKPEELVALFADEPYDFEPGEKFLYNNSGYFLLGMVIEKVSGKTYIDFLRERILDPQGLAHTDYGDVARIIPGRVPGYSKNEAGETINAEFISMTLPYSAGGLVSTVDDLSNWTRSLFAGEIVSTESLEAMTTPYTLNSGEQMKYGFGLGVGNLRGRRMIQHGGGIHGYTCASLYLPDDDVYVSVLSNSDSHGSPSRLAAALALAVFGEELEQPKPQPEPEPEEEN